MSMIYNIIEQSILFFPLTIGIYLSFCILKTTDMTTEGSFVLGASIFARLVSNEFSPIIGLLLSILSGMAAGIGVSKISAKGKINSLTAGIIALFILYSINFQVMGKPNISLISTMKIPYPYIVISIILTAGALGLLMMTRIGLILRAFGSNASLLGILGKNIELIRMLGLGISNALAAFCGAITAQTNGYADLGMGFGMTLTGISTVMIGQKIANRFFPSITFNAAKQLIACYLGVSSYFLSVNLLLGYNVDPIYLKCLLGIMLIFLLSNYKGEKS